MTVATIVASWFKVMGPAGPQDIVNRYLLVLWFEAVAVWAFALSWLAKGRAEESLSRLLVDGRRARKRTGRPGRRPDQNGGGISPDKPA
jgi:hypothetical protein